MEEEKIPEVERAIELSTPEGRQYALVALDGDGYVNFCFTPEAPSTPPSSREEVIEEIEKAVCRTSRRPEGIGLFLLTQKILEDFVPGATVKELVAEGE